MTMQREEEKLGASKAGREGELAGFSILQF